MTIKFKDGLEFKTEGDYRITRKSDGYYVVGNGTLVPAADVKEGKDLIADLKKIIRM